MPKASFGCSWRGIEANVRRAASCAFQVPEEEDAKRLHRSRANLLRERVRHVNRIRGLLHLQGVVHIHPHREGWTAALRGLETRDGRRFPERLMSEIKREAKLLAVVKKLLREVDLELVALVRAQESTRRSPR